MTAPLGMASASERDIAGFRILPGFLARAEQSAMADSVREVVRAAPLVRPVTRWGRAMSVRMTSAGRLGWVIERGNYRYVTRHPETGEPWPPIPSSVLAVWLAVSGWDGEPDCCLVNWYGQGARMGLHRDADEGDFKAPVVSISLGDPARFRMGGTSRKDPTASVVLNSGDVVILSGAARLAYHGIDRVLFGEDGLLAGHGRINLTLRVVRSA
ncbi:MAG: alpha-ketoglutarate-dependent dioxygenase AlkB family protein [Alphaproteobacteria bacterium]